jgi:type II secretory pathway pseudopilin PulG
MQDFVNWLAIVLAIVAITLAAVAIWFAVSVDRRARQQQTDLTLRSLLRVQAAVEAQVGDTQNLLRAGWERMAGSPAVAPDPARYVIDEPAEPATKSPKAPSATAPRMPVQYDRSRTEQPTQPAAATNGSETSNTAPLDGPAQEGVETRRIDLSPVQHWTEILGSLDPLAHELARALDAYTEPLHRPEYLVLARHRRTAPAVRELRRAGLLAPLPHRGAEDGPPVYGFPPGLAGPVHTAFEAGPRGEPRAATLVRDVLVEAGYLSRAGDDYVLAHRDDA